MSNVYRTSDVIFVAIVGVAIGFIFGILAFFNKTGLEYFKLKNRCKGVIGIVENAKEGMIEFECVGGN